MFLVLHWFLVLPPLSIFFLLPLRDDLASNFSHMLSNHRYANFLEEVRRDPWSAARYSAEADRAEDRLVEAHREAALSAEGGGADIRTAGEGRTC
jgi:hypothetical protein